MSEQEYGPCCVICRFWNPPKDVEELAREDAKGHCHRYAPRPTFEAFDPVPEGFGDPLTAFWPVTWGDEWCDEYEPTQTRGLNDVS
jgi:hypothetical protein